MEAPFADRVREPGDQRDRAEIEERRRRGRQPFQRQRRLLQVLRRELHQVPYRRPGNHHVEIAQGALRDAGARSQRSRVAAGRRDELREAGALKAGIIENCPSVITFAILKYKLLRFWLIPSHNSPFRFRFKII
jgi:hypothetical protein